MPRRKPKQPTVEPTEYHINVNNYYGLAISDAHPPNYSVDKWVKGRIKRKCIPAIYKDSNDTTKIYYLREGLNNKHTYNIYADTILHVYYHIPIFSEFNPSKMKWV